jgi:hypothetical protein
MQMTQTAKEKLHGAVFSLAASAAAATTKSEGTNPIPQPDTNKIHVRTLGNVLQC